LKALAPMLKLEKSGSVVLCLDLLLVIPMILQSLVMPPGLGAFDVIGP